MTSDQPHTRTVSVHQAGQRARERRELLHAAIVDLDAALEGPEDDEAAWCQAVRSSLTRMHATLEAHAQEAEASDGLLGRILAEEPVFGPRVAAMKREHEELIRHSAELMERCCNPMTPDELHEQAAGLRDEVERHRHRAADLLFDAYELDISAVD